VDRGRGVSDAGIAAEIPAVAMHGISKSFGGVRALDNVSLAVRRGEVHALLGENGAGKSTILKILRGVLPPDSGRIEVDGKALGPLSSETARRAGIAMIFQEMSLVPTLTVAQNILLNREIHGTFGLIDDRAAKREAEPLFRQLGVDVDPGALAGDLGTGQRQLTEIVKAMSQKARVLILDEPTSALSASEVEHLFTFIRRLKSEGVAVIYVSHRMDEIFRIADSATILRDGRLVTTGPISGFTLETMVTQIVGRRVGSLAEFRGTETEAGEPLLELDGLSGEFKPREVSLVVRRGEVVGIAGLLGSGRSSLARVVCGLDPLKAGTIRKAGRTIRVQRAGDAIANGIALIPEDRIRQGIVAEHSVASNICLPVLDRLSAWSWVFNRRADRLADAQIERLHIKTASRDSAVRTLSGGNQQKVVLAKWLATDPDILVLDEPTAGIDIGSKAEIIALVRSLARAGKAILLISSELSELITASDRIVIMSEGRIVREIASREIHGEEGARSASAADAEHRLNVILQQVH
jgi:ribose transport system ATP-binding protein